MQRLTAFVVAALMSFGVGVAVPAAYANPPVCMQYDSDGICTVWASGGGSGGGWSGGGGGGGTSICMNGHQAVPCSYNGGWWDNSLSCYVKAVSPVPPLTDPMWAGHTTGGVYYCAAYNVGYPIAQTGQGWFWLAQAPNAVDPAVLAQQAFKSLTIPSPSTGRYPAGTLKNGRPYTVVSTYTWYWTDPGTFKPLTASASAGGVTATVTVTPTSLSFTPGDGAASLSCAGPGTAWSSSYGVWAASPSGCDYRYPHSSIHEPNGEVTATYAINWTIAWNSTTGETGTLPALTTTEKSTFAVAEVESVVTH